MGKQLPGQGLPPTTNGPIEAVRCPHCGKPNDMRILQQQQLLDTGHDVECDHCNRIMEVVGMRQVTVIVVRKSGRRPGQAAPAQHARPATTLSPAQTRRLLRGR
jgi:hypothetical protein